MGLTAWRREKDDEVKGSGNSGIFKYRVRDPRLGRFLSVDPLDHNYPWKSKFFRLLFASEKRFSETLSPFVVLFLYGLGNT